MSQQAHKEYSTLTEEKASCGIHGTYRNFGIRMRLKAMKDMPSRHSHKKILQLR